MKQLTELSMLQLQFLNAGIQGNKQWGEAVVETTNPDAR